VFVAGERRVDGAGVFVRRAVNESDV